MTILNKISDVETPRVAVKPQSILELLQIEPIRNMTKIQTKHFGAKLRNDSNKLRNTTVSCWQFSAVSSTA